MSLALAAILRPIRFSVKRRFKPLAHMAVGLWRRKELSISKPPPSLQNRGDEIAFANPCRQVYGKNQTPDSGNVHEAWEKDIMKKVAGKKFVKVVVSEKGNKKEAKPQATNGAKMNC